MDGTILRRFKTRPPQAPKAVRPDASFVVEGRTKYPSTVVNPKDSPRLFVSGHNNRKIGKEVQKGPWKGMPIFTLTLEERATCPRDCAMWVDCYGNSMHMARRHRHGPELEKAIVSEIAHLASEYRRIGFVIRLHVLGDFYSPEYAGLWLGLLARHQSMRIFGYTAHRTGPVAELIYKMNDIFPDRCLIRTSGKEPGFERTIVVESLDDADGAIVCPAQTEKTECCATCALCWSEAAREKTIAFIKHGNPYRGRKGDLEMADNDNWIELRPTHLTPPGVPRVTLTAAQNGNPGKFVTFLGINRWLIASLGWKPSKTSLVKIEFGNGPNANRLRVSENAEGLYRLQVSGSSKNGQQGARLALKVPNQPDMQIKALVLTHKVADKYLIIDLPKEWATAQILAPSDPVKTVRAVPKVEPQKPVDLDIHEKRQAERPAPARVEPVELAQKVPSIPSIEQIQPHESQSPLAKSYADHGITMVSRFLNFRGGANLTLMSDEIALMRELLSRIGEVVPNGGLKRIENSFGTILTRLQKRLNGSRITLMQKQNGWALLWSDDPRVLSEVA